VMFYLPLRLGGMLRLARRRMPAVPIDALEWVNRLPLRFPRKASSSEHVVFEPGVAEALSPLLEPELHGDMYSRYDLAYYHWQLDACPLLSSETCYLTAESTPRAAALLWRRKQSREFWRLALWSRKGAEKQLEALLAHIVRHVYECGGFLLSIVVSRHERAVIDVLRRKRFLNAPRRRPLHIIHSKRTGEPVPELWPLSYLDTDFAYRF
jgi:hypothetical protein